MTSIKNIFHLQIPYWRKRAIGINLYWRFNDLMLSIWFYHKIDVEGYEDDWFFRTWKHVRIWRGR